MHILIYAIVEATTEDDALAAGKATFDQLVGAAADASAVFDYYVTFDETATTVAGEARWGERPSAAPVDSEAGQELLEDGREETKEEFERNLDRAKDALDDLDDEAIMRDEDLARHAFHNVGAYRGSSVFLYDEYGNGIRHRERLDQVCKRYEAPWIIPADVHF